MQGNGLTSEAWRGLISFGRPQAVYLHCLVVQAVAVLIWWPGGGLYGALATQKSPNTLLVVLTALGVSLSYQSIRIGAEELLFPDQQPLRGRIVSTRLAVWRILLGYLGAHVIQTLHWVALSTPVLLAAWSVGGGDWRSLGFCLLVIFFLATVYRLAGACVHLAIGQHEQTTYYILRITLIAGYLIGGMVFPATSHWRLTEDLLSMSYASSPPGTLSVFLQIYGLVSVLLSLILCSLALRLRHRWGANVTPGA
ncbi:MAG: hypothetical protein ACR2RB_09305 [Gammaproteobacteria bacterium]